MQPRIIRRTITIILGFLAFVLADFSAVEAKPTLKAPARVTINTPFWVIIQQAPKDLTWNYDSSQLKIVEQRPGRVLFAALSEGPVSLEASSPQTGWSSGIRTVQVLPATGAKKTGKTGTAGETAADPIAESPKMQKVKTLLDKYKATLGQAGLEGQFTRKDSGAEKQKVKLSDDQARNLGQISEQFLAEMNGQGLTMHDLMEFRRVMGEAAASPGSHALFPGSGGWDATYLGTERALMMGRAVMINQVWIETISEAYRRHPDWVGVDKGQNPVIYGRMDIGSWVKMDLAGLAFKADIDSSSLATSLAANREVKAIFVEMLQKHLQNQGGDLPRIIDAVLTPHGAAGEEVFIGEWGQAFAEVDMLKRSSWTLLIPEVDAESKPVFDDQGRIKLKTKVMSGQALFWERAFRTGKEFKPPMINIEVEPMLSLEMLRHMTADVVNSPAFGRGDKIVKMLKYVERSYFYNKKATAGTGWDPYAQNDPELAQLCNELFKERKEGDKKVTWSKDPEKVAALLEQLNGGPITEGNVNELVQNLAEKCRKAIVRNSEMGLSARLRKIADIEDETKRNEALDKLWDQMERELKAFEGSDPPVKIPAEINHILMLAKAFQMGLVGPELVKTMDELRKLYTDVLELSKEVCDKLLITDAWNKVREYCKKKLKWKDQQVEEFVKKAKGKYPNAVEFYGYFQRFNDRLSTTAGGSMLLSTSDWADNGLSVYEAFMSGKDENECYRKAAWQMGQIFMQVQIPESAIPIALLNSLSEGSPAPVAMAVAFYYFPWVGQFYTLGVNLRRLDVGMRDKEFYNSLDQMLKVTDFDQSGKITRFALKDATGKYARDEADVSPPGSREVIVQIFEAPESPFAIAPNFRYWRALIPDASDYYSYTTKLQNLRRFFPHSEEIRFWTLMLENTKGQEQKADAKGQKPLPDDRYEAQRQELLAQMEKQLQNAVWMAMADALESAAKSSNQAQVDEWKKKIAELEREFSLSDLDLGKNKGLQGQINFEILQATGKLTQWTQGDNIYAVGQIYEKYIKAYTDLLDLRSKIFRIWNDFHIDTSKALSSPMKLLLDGNAKSGAPALNGNPEHDLAQGQKALAAHQARATKIKNDLADALGRPTNTNRDSTHLRILGQYGFEWEHLRDDAAEPGEEIKEAAVRSAVVPQAMSSRYKNYVHYLALLKTASTLGVEGPDTVELGQEDKFKATTAGDPKLLPEFRLLWTDPAKLGEGPALTYAPKKAGTAQLTLAAVARIEDQDITMGQAVKAIQVAGEDGVIQLSDPQPAVNQQITATLVLKAGLPRGAQVQWRTSGGVKLVGAKGLAAKLLAQGNGQVMAILVQKGQPPKEFSAPVTLKSEVLAGGLELTPPQPEANQKVTATLVVKGGAPKGAQVRWRTTGGVKLAGAKGLKAALTAQGNGQIIATLVQKGKVLKEYSATVTIKPPGSDQQAGGDKDKDKDKGTGAQDTKDTGKDTKTDGKTATGGDETGTGAVTGGQDTTKTGQDKGTDKTGATTTGKDDQAAKFPIKLRGPGEVGSTEIFKVAVDVPAEFAGRNLEYMWSISGYGHLLNPVNSWFTKGPEAVIQPNYDWMVQKGLSTLEISVAVDEMRGFRSKVGDGKVVVKVRPEGFSAKAPKSWTGKADRNGVNLYYGKKETMPNGLIIGMYSGQLTVRAGEPMRILASDGEEVAAPSMPPGAKPMTLGDFKGYLVEKPPTDNSGGVGSLSGEFSKGKITFTVDGRVSCSLGAVANNEQIQAGKQRLQSLYQEMLEAVKSVRLGSGGGMVWTNAAETTTATGDKTKDQTTKETKETPKPLTVKLNAAKTQLLPGESLPITAAVANGDPKDVPLTYTWSGEHTGQGTKVEFAATKPGKYTLKVDVKSPKGATGTASLTFDVGALKAEIVQVSPAGSTIPVGGTGTFKVNFKGVPGKSYVYQWQPHPEAVWTKPQGPATQATATFRRPETIQVWVKVLEKRGAALVEVAESQQISLTVVKPQLKLSINPTAPFIGQEVKARVEVSPVPPDLSLRWLPLPANAQMLKESQDGKEITFTLKDDKPVPIKVLALVKDKGDNLGEASGTVQAKKFQVSATVVGPLGPEPMKWDPVRKGLVPDPKAIAIHQNVRVKAAITPEPPKGPVRWRWAVNPDSHIVSGQGGAEIMVNRSQTGSCEITVTAEDSQGSDLGKASTAFSVSVNQGVISKEIRDAAQKKAAEGKLEEAIELMGQAVKLDPGSANTNYLKKLKADKETIAKQLEKTRSLISQGKFAEAEKELAAAKSLNAKYPPLVEAEKQLAAAKSGLKQQVETKLAQAKSLASQGRLDEAIKLAQEVAKLDPQNPAAAKLVAEWQGLKGKVEKLKAEGKTLESQGKLGEAITKYQEALKLLTDAQLAQHMAELQGKLTKERQSHDLGDKLRKEGEVLEGQKKLVEAIGKYQESLKYLPDSKLSEHVKALQAKLGEEKQKLETAKRLRNEGAALQQQGKLAEAITKYQESLKSVADPNLEAHIKTLQAKLDQAKQKQLAQEKEKQEKAKQTAANKETAKRLRNEGVTLQQQGKLAEAITKYRESLRYYPDPGLEAHIKTLQTKLDQAKQNQAAQEKAKQGKEKQAAANKETARRLINEGVALSKQGNMNGALAKFKEAYTYFPDPKLKNGIDQLEAQLKTTEKAKQDKEKQAAANKETAKRLINEGVALSKQGNVTGALAKLREAYRYLPDPRLKKAIDQLDAHLKATSKTQTASNAGVSDGNFSGSFNGRFTAGRVVFRVTGNRMNGTMNGTITWQSRQFQFTGSVQGTVNPKGDINGSLTGKSQGVNINGTFLGKVQGKSAGGTWQAKALMADSGNWHANNTGR
jgi:tetratricopeptide (TPR) repeat protein